MHRALLVSPLRYFMAIVTQCISLLSVHVSLFVLVWHISRKAVAPCKYRFVQFHKIVEDIGGSIASINDLACVLENVKRMLPWGFRARISRNLFGLYPRRWCAVLCGWLFISHRYFGIRSSVHWNFAGTARSCEPVLEETILNKLSR